MVKYDDALLLELNDTVLALARQYPAGAIQTRHDLVKELFVGVLGAEAADNVNGMHKIQVYDPQPLAVAFFNTSEGARSQAQPPIAR
jgi:hypothetical protein